MPDTSERTPPRLAGLYLGVVALPAVVLGIVGVFVGLVWWGLLLGLIIGVAVAAWARGQAERSVLRLVGARPAPEHEFRRYHNLVEGLCVTSGLDKPSLWVVDDPAANALAVGLAPSRASLVVTTGLLEALPRIELEGVVASLLGQIRSGDAATANTVAALVAPLAPLGTLASSVAQRFVEQGCQSRHDVTAVRITRYPPGMVAALEHLAQLDTRPRTNPGPCLHLWLIPPSPASHTPTLDERIAILREL